MKNITSIVVAGFVLLMTSCSTQGHLSSEKVHSLLQSGEFTFMAERANPAGNDAVRVMNSLPNTSSSQILNLDYGYNLTIKKDEIKAELPYFGRAYAAQMDPSKNSYRFTSTDFNLEKSAGKKGSSVYTISTKDQPTQIRMVLEVFDNGTAYLNMSSNDRAPISFDGYIKETGTK